jgi:hypothetical protein
MEGGFGRSITALCIEAGVSRPTFYEWMKEDEGFIKAWQALPEKILRPAIPGVIQAMITKAKAGDVQAGRLILELANVYVPVQKHEHSGPNGQPIKTEVTIDYSKIPDEELREYESVLAKLRARMGSSVEGASN